MTGEGRRGTEGEREREREHFECKLERAGREGGREKGDSKRVRVGRGQVTTVQILRPLGDTNLCSYYNYILRP